MKVTFDKNKLRTALLAASWLLILGVAVVWTGCGSLHGPYTGLPIIVMPAGQSNSYTGKAVTSVGYSDSQLWNVTIDHNQNTFTYNATGSTASPPVMGGLTQVSGFLLLLNASGYQTGFGLEIPGRIVILRPGNSSTAPIIAVQQPSCFAVSGNVKFQYIVVPSNTTDGTPAFGKIYAATSADGSAWNFDGLTQYQADLHNQSSPTNADNPPYPTSFDGTCTAANGAASISIPASPTYSVPTNFIIGPTGFFLEDQNYATGDMASFGISGPNSAVSTSSVAGGSYLGFLIEANTDGTYLTEPVGFGNIVSSKSTLSGGAFPNEDPSQPAGTNMSIAFGGQDPLNNGLYYLAKLTLPVSGSEALSCTSPGTDSNGNPTCTYKAIATVGSAESKYAIFLTAYDGNSQKILVLLQQ